MGLELRPGREGGIRVDLEAHGLVARQVGLHERGADARERVQHHAGLGDVARQRIRDEVLRIAGYPRHPSMHRRLPIGHESRVSEARESAGSPSIAVLPVVEQVVLPADERVRSPGIGLRLGRAY